MQIQGRSKILIGVVWLASVALHLGALPAYASPEGAADDALRFVRSPPLSITGRDYLWPAESKSLPLSPGKTGTCFECSRETVTYKTFNGQTHSLIRYTGRHVSILVPAAWPDSEGFTQDELRLLLDRSDLLYAHFRDITQGEPRGDGPLPIAFVPETCGFGCGYVGSKGVEIANDRGAVELIRRELSAGLLNYVVVHELSHNFDLYSDQLYYLPDAPHAWTDFIVYYIHAYSRLPTLNNSADGVVLSALESDWHPYFDNPAADWATCVRDGRCDGVRANGAWAGVSLQTALLHGPDSVKAAMAFLSKQSPPLPADAAAKEDRRIDALAVGAATNIGCYADAWRWQASATLRNSMSSRFGGPSAFCADADNDGFSVVEGDCDDQHPSVFPGNPEVIDGRDNNCDRLADNVLLKEPAQDFPSPQAVPLPVTIEGGITDGDSDDFHFSLSEPGRVSFKLCSTPDFQGWLFVFNADGSWLDYQYVSAGKCSTHAYNLPEARTWRFAVQLNVSSAPGLYRVTATRLDAVNVPQVETLPVCHARDGTYRLRADATHTTVPPTEARFWVSGFGFIGAVPYAESMRFDWRPAATLPAGVYTYRAQLFANGNPVSDASAPQTLSATADAVCMAVTNIAKNDFNGDGKSDVFWRNLTDGRNIVWSSAKSSTQFNPGQVSNQAWSVVGSGDFDGDGKSDVFWRNARTGQNIIWPSGTSAGSRYVTTVSNLSWRVAAIADFNGDGRDDVFWRNGSTGQNTIWWSGQSSGSTAALTVPAVWAVAGTGDFDGDGEQDIVWRNTSTGANILWWSGRHAGLAALTGVSDQAWEIVAIGDFAGDGLADVFWRNRRTGENMIWRDGKYSSRVREQTASTSWKIVASGDYNGDGRADLFWRNTATGANMVWDSGRYATRRNLTSVTSSAWIVQP